VILKSVKLLYVRYKMLNGKSILITGGSGFFGKSFIEKVFRDYPNVRRIVVFSRDNEKHEELRIQFPKKQYPQLRFFIGDVRDYERLLQACESINIIIHAATLASLDATEYNPEECIKTNIGGAENVIKAALHSGVNDVISLSSDKACAPMSLYGATQLVSDKLFVAANNMIGNKNIRFSVIRYGSVLGMKGSVAYKFLKKKEIGGRYLPITDKKMTRFIITIQQVIESVLYAFSNHLGGEIFIPKSTSYRITDLATVIAPEMEQQEIGIRSGEKIHEELISEAESINTIDIGNQYVIIPSVFFTGNRDRVDYISHYGAHAVTPGFRYSSNENCRLETMDSLREKIKQHIYYK